MKSNFLETSVKIHSNKLDHNPTFYDHDKINLFMAKKDDEILSI